MDQQKSKEVVIPLFTVDSEKCVRCGTCVAACPAGLPEMKDKDSCPTPIEKAEQFCIHCGHCVSICPKGALSLIDMKLENCPAIIRELCKLSPDHVEQFLRFRRSIRNYKKTSIPKNILTRLIEIARYAPSGSNRQPVHWLVLDKPERFAALVVDWMRILIKQQPEFALSIQLDRVVAAWEHGINRITRDAPHLVIVHATKGDRTAHAACTIALTNLTLAAPAFNLGTCWSGYINTAAGVYPPLVEALGLPSDHETCGSMAIGYPKFAYHRLPLRKPPPITWK
jgi:nitroreductase/NAD-dependent dihydropyrimidine dehydrogenase PreA subunit